jgi:hypothetical protein
MQMIPNDIAFREAPSAPCQAWLAKLRDGKLECVSGAGVRRGPDWFFEGGWAYTDHPHSLSRSGVYLGSGAVWDGTVLSLIAPSHTADAVYVVTTHDAIFASNSLPFSLAGAGITDFPISQIDEIGSITKGLDRYSREIFRAPRFRVHRFCNAIVECRQGEEPIELPQEADVSRITSFEAYHEYLLFVIRQACRTYGSAGITVYLSSGYDSTACAALASQIGDDCIAISVDMARTGIADDGALSAHALGLRIATLKRANRIKNHAGHEHMTADDLERLSEFYIGMNICEECLSAPPELLAGRTILTGFHGDKIWDPSVQPSTELKRGDISGASMGEFRLRVGFLHIPVPMLAFRAHPMLKSIGLSDEMRPWRIGRPLRLGFLRIMVPELRIKTHPLLQTAWVPRRVQRWRNRPTYDRPIPRRIAEEAGVPRGAFGQKKLAAASLAINLGEIAPELFRRLTSRYQDAAEILRDPSCFERELEQD